MTTLQVSFTFQSGSIQMYFHLPCMYSHTALHSNLVLFKYGRSKKEFYNSYTFTFQSGSIQIKRVFLTSAISIPFTFQSGSIQMLAFSHSSTMYPTFTFQSGSIQINPLAIFILGKRYFTFQSGSIQILLVYLIKYKFNLLYIPIWFYSNEFHSRQS